VKISWQTRVVHFVITVIVGAAVLQCFGSATWAQAITGVVKDSSGAVVTGVTVEAASPALIEKTRTALTDSAGQYAVVGLLPGTYSVTYSRQGFSTVKRDNVQLAADFTAMRCMRSYSVRWCRTCSFSSTTRLSARPT